MSLAPPRLPGRGVPEMRGLTVLVIVASMFLAGCYGPILPRDEDEPFEDAPLAGLWIHHVDADGNLTLLPQNKWQERYGVLPVGGERRTGTHFWEPTLGADAHGTLFVHGFGKPALVIRSGDQGTTWNDVTPELGGRPYPPVSFDPFLHVDIDTGRIYASELQGLACSSLAWSDDKGKNWEFQPVACGNPFVHDHQNIWTSRPRVSGTMGYANVVQYCSSGGPTTRCTHSFDGGRTWAPLTPLATVQPTDDAFVDECAKSGQVGHGTAGPTGINFLPYGGRVDGFPRISRSLDDGTTWKSFIVNDTLTTTIVRDGGGVDDPACDRVITDDPDAAYDHEVAAAVDAAGNVYAMWIAEKDKLPRVSVSQDAGQTWGPALRVAPPDVRSTWFPTLAAGDDGRFVAAYYGSSSDKRYHEMTEEDEWRVYLSAGLNATSDDPLVATTTAHPSNDPVARGVCGGSRCRTDGFGVGDFIDVIIDPDGRPWVAFVDMCHASCVAGEPIEEGEGLLGTWLSGPRLRGAGPLDALEPGPDALAAPSAKQTFRHSTTGIDIGAPVCGGTGYSGLSVPDRMLFEVYANATQVMIEARWADPFGELSMNLLRRGRVIACFEEESLSPAASTRVVLDRSDFLIQTKYQLELYASQRAGMADVRVTVFYGDYEPSFSAFNGADMDEGRELLTPWPGGR